MDMRREAQGSQTTRRAVLGGAALVSGGVAAGRSRAGQPGAPTEAPVYQIGVTPNPRTWPLMRLQAQVPGLRYAVTSASSSELFYRQLRTLDFDASEMSMSTLMIAIGGGNRRFIPTPIFTSRYFFHTLTLVRRDAGIRSPADLKGKRVGIPEYHMTGALWVRGVLQDEFGLRPADVEWWVERQPGGSVGGTLGIRPPSGVTTRQIPIEKGIGSMMLSGELDAAVMYFPAERRTTTERSTEKLLGRAEIATLFPDPQAENARYYAKTGIHHINHGAVVKRETAERDPLFRDRIMQLFEAANDIADRQRLEHVEYHLETGALGAADRSNLSRRLVRYGVPANRKTLDTLSRYAFEQGFTPERIDMTAFFAGA